MKVLPTLLLLLMSTTLLADQPRSIEVTARSEIKVAPDEAVLELHVATRNEDLYVAKAKNDKIAEELIALTVKHSIPQVDVKLTDLDVSPYYGRYNARQETPIAYDFRRSFDVRVDDFAKIEPFLSDAFEAGLSHINRLHFRVSNQNKHQYEARSLAVTYAREKATHLTELTGMTLGNPLSITEGVEDNWDAGGMGGSGGFASFRVPELNNIEIFGEPDATHSKTIFTSLIQAKPARKKLVDINVPGQIIISAEVTIKFEMTP